MTQKAKVVQMAEPTEEKGLEFEVRRATPYDAVVVCRVLEEWLDAAAKVYPEADPDALMTWVLNTINEGYVVVAERPKARRAIIGVAGMIAAQVPWNNYAYVYRDQFFYVPKAHRKSGVARKLMSMLQIHAAQDGVPLIMAVISGANLEKVDRWYEIAGNDYVGGTFVYGLKDKDTG